MTQTTTARKPPVKIDIADEVAGTPFDGAIVEAVAAAPKWFADLRAAALQNFETLGVPTLKHEEWRATNLAPLMKIAFAPASEHPAEVTREQLASLRFADIDGPVLVFVNGRFVPELSSIDTLPNGATVLPLEEAVQSHEAMIRPHFERDGESQPEAFSSLNAALTEGGAFVHIAKDAQVEKPIIVLSIDTPAPAPGRAPIMTHPRNVIVAEAGCQAKVIERYVSLGESASFTNAVTDVVLGENAKLEHYFIEQQSPEAFNISVLRSRQAKDSNFHSHTVLLGGKLVRNNVHPILDGEPCECVVNGLYIAGGTQHMDNHMRVEHAKPYGDSRQFYKGILSDRATAVFSGRIVVHEGAQKTDAKQSNMNLLLDDTAAVTTKPQLEIYADDVKCTHGATIGQLDDAALFYLRSRGLTETDARNMLIYAFAGESLERMELEPMRRVLERLLFERLPHGKLLERAHA